MILNNTTKLTNFPKAFIFFPTCHALKTWFELSRVKLYRNNLKGNKNYFELTRGSSYRGMLLKLVNGEGNREQGKENGSLEMSSQR